MNSAGDNIVMATRRQSVKEVKSNEVGDTIYVAVAKDVKDSKLNVVWAIQNSGGKRICILHVHVPSPKIPMSKCFCYFILLYYTIVPLASV